MMLKLIAVISEVCAFFLKNSPKRQAVLDAVFKKLCPGSKKKTPLTQLCITRWQERIIAWRDFRQSIVVVDAALDIIAGTRTMNLNLPADLTFDTNSKGRAALMIGSIRDPTFLVGIVCLDKTYTPLLTPTTLLQGRDMDVLKAYKTIDGVIAEEKRMRSEIDDLWEAEFWPEIQSLAEEIDVDLTPRRRTARQQHRRNTEGEPKEYFKGKAIQMLDQVISDLESRFGDDQKKVAQILFMHPEKLRGLPYEDIRQELEEVVNDFEFFFDDKELLYSQVRVLQHHLKNHPEIEDVADLYLAAFEFSEVKKLVQIVLTYPVTSCEAERSFSTMRRLFNWLRSTMTTTRLNNLAVCHIHRARLFKIPNSEIKKTFVDAKCRRLNYGGSFMLYLLTSSVLFFQQLIRKKKIGAEIIY